MKPKEGCGGCSRRCYREMVMEESRSLTGCETLLDELRPLGIDCWRPSCVIFVYDEKEV